MGLTDKNSYIYKKIRIYYNTGNDIKYLIIIYNGN